MLHIVNLLCNRIFFLELKSEFNYGLFDILFILVIYISPTLELRGINNKSNRVPRLLLSRCFKYFRLYRYNGRRLKLSIPMLCPFTIDCLSLYQVEAIKKFNSKFCFLFRGGVEFSGKIAIYTATLPYILLIVLLIRGLFLEGAMKGLYYLFVPDITKLFDPMVWVDAANQVIF